MLRGVGVTLAERGHAVSVVARRRPPLDAMVQETASATGIIHPVAVDYRDAAAFDRALDEAECRFGSFGFAVAWIRSDAPAVRDLLFERLTAEGRRTVRCLLVRGSATCDPSLPDSDLEQAIVKSPTLRICEVILGYEREGYEVRWMTHDEIVNGVLAAIDSGEVGRRVVGCVRPWLPVDA